MAYQVGEFARLAGVTVRALQHYDRLGLLRPSRTEANHRQYTERDRQRVRHILALRAIGMSLLQVKDALAAAPSRLNDIFLDQRANLEQSRTGINEAIRALDQVATADVATNPLDRLATVVEMQEALEVMRGYFTDDAWTRWGQDYFHDWPSAAWRALFREIEASLDEDPSGDHAQELLDRWTTLWEGSIGPNPSLSRAVREGYGKAWKARDRWPREMQRRYAEFEIEAIARFLGAASMASWRRRGLIQTYTAGRLSTA